MNMKSIVLRGPLAARTSGRRPMQRNERAGAKEWFMRKPARATAINSLKRRAPRKLPFTRLPGYIVITLMTTQF